MNIESRREKILELTEKLRDTGDVSREEALFVWKSLILAQDDKLGQLLRDWYKSVYKAVKSGKTGNFVESVHLYRISDKVSNMLRSILELLPDRMKESTVIPNVCAVQRMFRKELSMFDFVLSGMKNEKFHFSDCLPNTAIFNIRLVRCGIYDRIVPKNLHKEQIFSDRSKKEYVKAALLETADFSLFFTWDSVYFESQYQKDFDELMSLCPEILADIKDINRRDASFGRRLARAVLERRTLEMPGPLLDKDMPEVRLFNECIQKGDITPEEADEIRDCTLIFNRIGEDVENYKNIKLSEADNLFRSWFTRVSSRLKNKDVGNFVFSLPLEECRNIITWQSHALKELSAKDRIYGVLYLNTPPVQYPDTGIKKFPYGTLVFSEKPGAFGELKKLPHKITSDRYDSWIGALVYGNISNRLEEELFGHYWFKLRNPGALRFEAMREMGVPMCITIVKNDVYNNHYEIYTTDNDVVRILDEISDDELAEHLENSLPKDAKLKDGIKGIVFMMMQKIKRIEADNDEWLEVIR